jgi:hypothetical protein
MGIVLARLLPLVLLLAPLLAQGKEAGALKRTVAGVDVDWSAGTLTAQAGSAADLRMPGPNSARPGAERRARVAAEAKLSAALAAIAHGKTIDEKQVLTHATVARTEYQSDGGVVLWLTLRFSDVVPAKPASVALRVAAMPLEFSPVILLAGREAPLGFATYRSAVDGPRDAIRAQRDDKGRLSVAAAAGGVDSLAGSAVVIYLEKTP